MLKRLRTMALSVLSASALLALSGPASPVLAQSEDGFQAYLQSLWPKAQAMGVSRRTFDSVVTGLTYNPRVVQLDNSQPGGSTNSPIPAFAPYRNTHVDASRINRGRAKYRALRPFLAKVEAETGVPESIMVAIYGHETNYGAVLGDFDLPRSLATLAYEGRRRSLFEPEFLATLKMIENGYPRSQLVGSWAGAFGYPQFLPTVYLRLAKDGDGDGRANIRTSEADALASIANYFRQSGWRRGEDWGFAVTVPQSLNRSAIATKLKSPRCPRVHERHSQWKSIDEWKQLGIMSRSGSWPAGNTLATLIEPDGPNATAYLLTGNYKVILDYNCSNFYGLTVGLLADEVSR
ncbi:lytic murein transglycosylase [Pseudonocardia sp. TMWB2A]|uniref:lytic murein transglycosylase n=1 Tax=Pseudonocardia sp. TMWB2A TaxID=687430 RepID=UPI00307EE9AC